jgi:hypothetical protein
MKKSMMYIAAVVLLFVTPLLLVKTNQVKAMDFEIVKQDIPEYGLKLVIPSDQSFDSLLSPYLKSDPELSNEDMKSFCVFLKNESALPIVAYLIRWELNNEKGEVVPNQQDYTNFAAFTNSEDISKQNQISNYPAVISPDTVKLFSLLPIPPEDLPRNTLGGSTGYKEGVTDINHIAQERDKKLQILRTKFKGHSTLTVSIDGAFFCDGTFVGQNTTDFFAKVKSNFDAMRDLYQEFLSRLKGRNPEEAYKRLEMIANTAIDVEAMRTNTLAEAYNYYKRGFAREMLRMRDKMGEQQMIKTIESRKPSKTILKKL